MTLDEFVRAEKKHAAEVSNRRSRALFLRQQQEAQSQQRIAKVMARSDLGLSRREAERLIAEGGVTLNGEKVATPAVLVNVDTTRASGGGGGRGCDVVAVRGRPLTFHHARSLQVYVAHKLPGELVTNDDPQGRPTILERLKNGKGLRRLMSQLVFVGRLDFQSEGLILLTNNVRVRRERERERAERPRG